MEDTIIVDTEWLDARFFRPAKNGRYRVILDGWEKRATFRDGKWSRNIEAFKSAEYERI
jgi:hypothetical protein